MYTGLNAHDDPTIDSSIEIHAAAHDIPAMGSSSCESIVVDKIHQNAKLRYCCCCQLSAVCCCLLYMNMVNVTLYVALSKLNE